MFEVNSVMGLNLLAQISAAKPVIFAEGLFISCYLQNEKFVPEQGIDKSDIISILNGEFFKSGTDFVEDFTVSLIFPFFSLNWHSFCSTR